MRDVDIVTVCVGSTASVANFIQDMVLKDSPGAITFPLVVQPDGEAPKDYLTQTDSPYSGMSTVLLTPATEVTFRFQFADDWAQHASKEQAMWIIEQECSKMLVPIEFDEEHVMSELSRMDDLLGNIST